MTTGSATYPLQRANSTGYLTGETLPSADANTIDNNAASGADGACFTDLASATSFVLADAMGSTYGHCLGTAAFTSSGRTSRYLLSFGVSAGNPLVAWSPVSSGLFSAASGYPGAIDAGAGLTPVHGAFAANSANAIMGGTPGSGSTSKIRHAALAHWGAAATPSFVARATIASSTEAVNCAVWHSGASLFVIGLSNTAATNIETSPTGQTWTQITGLPNTNARAAMASNGTTIVCTANASTDKCIKSTNGSTWTESTLPATKTWSSVVYDSVNAIFVASSTDGAVATSPDGTTWTSRLASGSFIVVRASCVGRMIFGTSNAGVKTVCAGYFDRDLAFYYGEVAIVGFDGSYDTRSATAGNGVFAYSNSNGGHQRSFVSKLLV